MEKFKKGALWFFKSFLWLGLLLLIIDIVTKNVIVANREYISSLPGGRIDLIPGFLGITYLVNRNAAFGLGTTSDLANRIIYIVMASIASAVLIAVYVKYYKKLGKMYKACLNLMLVGALGNLIDRIFFTPGYLGLLPSEQPGVVDWIDFYGIWRYVFNIADSAIVIGTIMLIVWLIIEEVRDSKKRNAVTLKKDVVEAKIEAQKVEEAPKEESGIEEVLEAAPVEEEAKEEVPEVKEEKEAPKKKSAPKKVKKPEPKAAPKKKAPTKK